MPFRANGNPSLISCESKTSVTVCVCRTISAKNHIPVACTNPFCCDPQEPPLPCCFLLSFWNTFLLPIEKLCIFGTGPLPDVSAHIIKSQGIGRIACHRSGLVFAVMDFRLACSIFSMAETALFPTFFTGIFPFCLGGESKNGFP